MRLLRTMRAEHLATEASQTPPFGPGFTAEEIAEADHMEVWGSTFSDETEDYTVFKLFVGDMVIAERRVEGF